MRAAVLTDGRRDEYLIPLLRVLTETVEHVKVFYDTERRGHWWNLQRTMDYMLDIAEKDEPILLTCDDVITIPEWRERWEKIHKESQDGIYVLHYPRKHLFTKENCERGYVKKCQLRGYYDHAVVFVNQGHLMSSIKDWHKKGRFTKPLLQRGKWLDIVIQEYLVANGIEWTITTPSLFKHVGHKSTLGHDIKSSPCYIGDL